MADSAPSPSVAESAPPNSDIMALMNAVTSAPAKPAKGYPPYAPYSMTPAPPSVADTINAGHDIRLRHKSMPRRPAKPPPRPARPRGPKATDVKMSKRATRAHALCLKRHGAILTDRLEKISKPQRRTVIYLWREHADTLPAYTIARLRNMLDADEPFKPDQAYEYFINLRKTKKKIDKARGVNQIKKDLLAVCADKRFAWARNATVSFARGIQQRLAKPGNYALSDSMLRLSNIVLSELCCYMNTRPPSRRCTHPKAKFLMEMADKIAVWIDDILTESDDRMLMMDFDEDEEVTRTLGDDALPGPSRASPVKEVVVKAAKEAAAAGATAAVEAAAPAAAKAAAAAKAVAPVAAESTAAATPTASATPAASATPTAPAAVAPGAPTPTAPPAPAAKPPEPKEPPKP